MNSRLENEKAHGLKLSEHAEDIWGWTTPAGQLRAQRRANLMVQHGGIKKGDTVLELGCGTGLFTQKVWEQTGATIIATDLSEVLLDQAREKLPHLDFRAEDAMQLSFSDASFDVVFGSSILHHLDFAKSLQEIHRVLKPGGRLAFAEPNMMNPQILVQKNVGFIKERLGDSPDETAVLRWSFARLLRENGFKRVRVQPYDFLHPYTPAPLIPLVKALGRAVERTPLVREIAGSVIISGQKI